MMFPRKTLHFLTATPTLRYITYINVLYTTTARRSHRCTGWSLSTVYLLTYLLTPWSRVLLENLTGSAFLEPEGLSPYSQVPATRPYPEPTPSSPHNPLPLPEDPS